MKKFLILIGIVFAFFLLNSFTPPEGLTPSGWTSLLLMAAAVALWAFAVMGMGILSVMVSIVPIFLGLAPLPKVMASFWTPTLLFLIAMFVVCFAFRNSGLSKRIVLWAVMKSGGNSRKLLLWLMLTCGLLSSVLADIPTMAMILPIALMLCSVNECEPGKSNLGRGIMLGLVFSCLIGGAGTPMGANMNMISIGMLEKNAQVQISFLEWCCFGMPLVLLLVPAAWFVLLKIFPPEVETLKGMDILEAEYRELGPLSAREKRFLLLGGANFMFWCVADRFGVPTPLAAVLGATLLSIPVFELVDWRKDAREIGWDMIMMCGALGVLGDLVWNEGGATWLAQNCLSPIMGLPLPAIIMFVSAFTILAHCFIPNNVALAGVLMPAAIAFAAEMGINPALLGLPLAFSLSAGLLLPLDPVALLAMPHGFFRMKEMCRPGGFISLVWVVVVTLIVYILAPLLGFM